MQPTDAGTEAETEVELTVIPDLGALPAGAIVTEAGLAQIFHRCRESIKRSVSRGELPAPARMFGSSCWTAGAIIKHFEKRLDQAARDAGAADKVLRKHSA